MGEAIELRNRDSFYFRCGSTTLLPITLNSHTWDDLIHKLKTHNRVVKTEYSYLFIDVTIYDIIVCV